MYKKHGFSMCMYTSIGKLVEKLEIYHILITFALCKCLTCWKPMHIWRCDSLLLYGILRKQKYNLYLLIYLENSISSTRHKITTKISSISNLIDKLRTDTFRNYEIFLQFDKSQRYGNMLHTYSYIKVDVLVCIENFIAISNR